MRIAKITSRTYTKNTKLRFFRAPSWVPKLNFKSSRWYTLGMKNGRITLSEG